MSNNENREQNIAELNKRRQMRKVGLLMSLMMGFTMSLILSLVGTLTSGHFTVISWLISFGISFVISMVIGLIVPMKKVGDGFCKVCKANPESFKGNLLSGLISNLIYTPIITVAMVCIMVSNAAKHAPAGHGPSLAHELPKALIISLVVGYIVIILVQPLFMKILLGKKKNK